LRGVHGALVGALFGAGDVAGVLWGGVGVVVVVQEGQESAQEFASVEVVREAQLALELVQPNC